MRITFLLLLLGCDAQPAAKPCTTASRNALGEAHDGSAAIDKSCIGAAPLTCDEITVSGKVYDIATAGLVAWDDTATVEAFETSTQSLGKTRTDLSGAFTLTLRIPPAGFQGYIAASANGTWNHGGQWSSMPLRNSITGLVPAIGTTDKIDEFLSALGLPASDPQKGSITVTPQDCAGKQIYGVTVEIDRAYQLRAYGAVARPDMTVTQTSRMAPFAAFLNVDPGLVTVTLKSAASGEVVGRGVVQLRAKEWPAMVVGPS